MSSEITTSEISLPQRSGIAQKLDQGFVWLTRIFGIGVAVILISMVVKVGIDAFPAISKFGLGFLFSSDWDVTRDAYGVLPQIYGTLVSSLIALLVAVPVGVGVAVFLSEDFEFLPNKVQEILVFLVELLAAIPSVVYGLWGIFVLIPVIKPVGDFLFNNFKWFPLFSTPLSGTGMLPAALVLAIMILPTIAAISREALISVPKDMRQASMGLGATRWETIVKVLIPASFSGIVGAVMLALGRAMGETMAVTMLIGNASKVNFSILAPSNSIAAKLANEFAEADGLQISSLMYAAFVLFALTLLVNILAELLILRVQRIK
ncbi:phosphate ABC transporter permease subunit PstC [Pseudanabaena sp. UWO310]|uniref:phosphate ABC transporter permease subunit PstC n=1 Tax=Pseudanabaena sp. UWO310 TaxID=2480795 RepID=UPI0011578A72|nr:phosphate ABC transporter permease subunit PstC [Pseudanabaena sp. UWO310]TYQ30472.1 phosphate ABC transporter permease subunit PstC [Pseudanabaena sp. UWO310]